MPAHQHQSSGRFVGVGVILLTLAGWTVVPIFIKMFTHDVDAWTSNGWRYGFAALLWLPLLIHKRRRGTWKPGLMRAAAMPGLINAAAQVCFTASFYKIDPGLVAFGLRSQIVAVTIGAVILYPAERTIIRKPLFIAGLALLIGGTLTTVGGSHDFGTNAGAVGIALAVASGIGYAGYALGVRSCMAGFGAMESFAAISQYTAGAMVLLMLLLAKDMGVHALDMPTPRFGLFLLSAVIGIAVCHVLYYIAIARLGVTISTGVIQLQPFTVSALSYIAFGEILTALQWAGGVAAVGGAITMLVVQHVVQSRLKPGPHSEAQEFADLPPDQVAAATVAEGFRGRESRIHAADERSPEAESAG
ncbi:MAG: DMT family transporter [Phycisphaeraceae bacterium]|nr:MAG: DMT family transporter [Phycisphaeraceae bacterium]